MRLMYDQLLLQTMRLYRHTFSAVCWEILGDFLYWPVSYVQHGCRGDGISVPIPAPYPYPWGSPYPWQTWYTAFMCVRVAPSPTQSFCMLLQSQSMWATRLSWWMCHCASKIASIDGRLDGGVSGIHSSCSCASGNATGLPDRWPRPGLSVRTAKDPLVRRWCISYSRGVVFWVIYLLLFGIPSHTHSFFPGLKPSFSANPSHRSPSFLLLKYLLRGFPGLFTVISEHICFLLLVFSVFTLF